VDLDRDPRHRALHDDVAYVKVAALLTPGGKVLLQHATPDPVPQPLDPKPLPLNLSYHTLNPQP